MPNKELLQKSILEVSAMLRKREVSPVELTKECLAQIERLNPTLNAFIVVTADSALAQARDAEGEILKGAWRGPLHGVPLALKDLVDVAGIGTTAASALFKNRIATEDAEVVRRLKDAGAILLGKQNLHECAYGGSSMISYFGEVHNPWNPARISGGSSGGSTAAVAAGLCYGAIGTDTAGSIREPAALCGIVGLKPTYGRVSARGIIPLSSSLDHVGPLTRTVADAAAMLQVVAGFDAQDPTSVNMPTADYLAAMNKSSKPARIGVPRKYFYEDLDPEIAAAVEMALRVLRELGGGMIDLELEVPTDRTLQSAESYAYHKDFVAGSPELYQPETLRRIRRGEGLTVAEVERAHRDHQRTRSEIKEVFAKVDFLVTPTTPIPAPAIEELKRDPDLLRPRELVLLRNTRPVNVWGLPAISIPCGFTAAGLPIGLQIIGPHSEEGKVLQLAHAYEQVTEWHNTYPKMLKVP